jgi:hypothetical protein
MHPTLRSVTNIEFVTLLHPRRRNATLRSGQHLTVWVSPCASKQRFFTVSQFLVALGEFGGSLPYTRHQEDND